MFSTFAKGRMNLTNFTFLLICLLGLLHVISTMSAVRFPNYIGKVFRVVAVIHPPYVYKNDTCLNATKDALNKTQCYSGYCVDLLNTIQSELHFNWTITETVEYGSINNITNTTSDKWDGMIGELVNKRGDVGLGAVEITPEREAVVDFSFSFYKTIDVMKKAPIFYSFALQKGSNFTVAFDHVLKKLSNQRMLDYYKEKWWNQNPYSKYGNFTSS